MDEVLKSDVGHKLHVYKAPILGDFFIRAEGGWWMRLIFQIYTLPHNQAKCIKEQVRILVVSVTDA